MGGQPTLLVQTNPETESSSTNLFQSATGVVLTIDMDFQSKIENILDKAINRTEATNGVIIVMDPHSGEIYGMASSPRLNLNEFYKYSEVFPNSPYNPAVSSIYEPGTIMGTFTIAIGFDSNSVTPQTTYLDAGRYDIGGVTINNWDKGAWGVQSMDSCLAHGLSVCFTRVADLLGERTFYTYLQNFGFGQLTGIDLVSEESGIVKNPSDADWYKVDLGTNSFGQGIAVTPIQVVMAASAFSNGGQMVIPHVVRSILYQDHQTNIPPIYGRRPILGSTANQITDILAGNLERNQSPALVEGYRIAGETGTGMIPDKNGIYQDYSAGNTNTSFIGWGPVENPRFIIYVWLQSPKSSAWASITSAPVFAEVVNQFVTSFDVHPSR